MGFEGKSLSKLEFPVLCSSREDHLLVFFIAESLDLLLLGEALYTIFKRDYPNLNLEYIKS